MGDAPSKAIRLADGPEAKVGMLVYHPHSRPARIRGFLDDGFTLEVESLGETSTWWTDHSYSEPEAAIRAELGLLDGGRR